LEFLDRTPDKRQPGNQGRRWGQQRTVLSSVQGHTWQPGLDPEGVENIDSEGLVSNIVLKTDHFPRHLFIQKLATIKRLLTIRKMLLTPMRAIYFFTITSKKNEDFFELKGQDIVKYTLFQDLLLLSLH
jgi:hypothetical protein